MARHLRILYHHRTRSRDGQSVHIDALIAALKRLGHEVEIVEPQRVAATESGLRTRLALPRSLYEILELCYSAVEAFRLAAAIRRFKPDAIYERANIFMLSGAWVAKKFRLPYLLEVNAPLAEERGSFGGLAWPRLARWTERFIWRAADRVLPVTAVLKRHLIAAGVPEERIAVVPNGVDAAYLQPTDMSEAKRRLGLDGRLVLGFVGFVREWHGLEQLIDLLSEERSLSTASLLIVGDGPATVQLKSRAARAGLADRVAITGVVPHDRIPDYVSAMDIALQPEVRPYASPLKLIEYMALGRAIVAPDSDNIREVLDPETNGIVFPQGDLDGLRHAIVRLASDGTLRGRLGAAASAKVRAQDFTWEHNARVVSGLMGELMEAKVVTRADRFRLASAGEKVRD